MFSIVPNRFIRVNLSAVGKAVTCAALATVSLFSSPSAGQVRIDGVVLGADDTPLSATHVLVESTTRGTITNVNGVFSLRVHSLPAILEIRHIGYRTERLQLHEPPEGMLTITLEPSVYALGEIVVAGRDLAEGVMRRVIRRKQEAMKNLPSYSAGGYSRIVVESDNGIVSIHESVFDLFWEHGRDSKAVMRSLRETSDLHSELGIAPGGAPVANLYADTILIRGVPFVGPTHPDAFDYYSFQFGRARSLDDQTVYDLYVAPLDDRYATFIGTVSVLVDEEAMLQAELRPARHVSFRAPTVLWSPTIEQQFFPVGDVWLPVDLRVHGSLMIRSGDQDFGPATVTQQSRFSGYDLDVAIPDDVRAASESVLMDPESIARDYLFARGLNIIPLTPREAEALFQLMTSEEITLARAFPPSRSRLSAAAIRPQYPLPNAPQFVWPRVAGYQPIFRLNRVDGYLTGIGATFPLSRELFFEWRLAQAFGLERVRYHAKLTHVLSNRTWISGRYAVDTDVDTSTELYPSAVASLATQLGEDDYFNYYWREDAGITFGFRHDYGRASITASDERPESVDRSIGRVWPFTDSLDANPAVGEPRIQSVTLSITLGQNWLPFRNGSRRGITIDLEQGVGLIGDAVGYTALRMRADYHLATLHRSRLKPGGLHIRLAAFLAHSETPARRYGVIHSAIAAFGTQGALRGWLSSPLYGRAQLGVFWEHDFRGSVFEWLGLPGIAERGTSIRIFGGHAWNRRPDGDLRSGETTRHELGVSLGNPFDLPVRVDAGIRLTDGVPFVGFGIGRF